MLSADSTAASVTLSLYCHVPMPTRGRCTPGAISIVGVLKVGGAKDRRAVERASIRPAISRPWGTRAGLVTPNCEESRPNCEESKSNSDTGLVVRGLGRAFLCLSVCLSVCCFIAEVVSRRVGALEREKGNRGAAAWLARQRDGDPARRHGRWRSCQSAARPSAPPMPMQWASRCSSAERRGAVATAAAAATVASAAAAVAAASALTAASTAASFLAAP
eukprot:scaffold85767_cov63-Phaeocystis_antarctica.AAC.2